MRTITPALAAHFDGESLTLAICCKIVRASDGQTFGFTTHDRDLIVGGFNYEASSSIEASALRAQVTNGVAAADNFEVIGLLTSDRITKTDLLAGLYDNAAVDYFVVNWSNVSQGRVTLLRGVIGAVKVKDGAFTAEVRSLVQRLNQQIGDITTKNCRVRQFGDAQCLPPGGIGAYQDTGNVSSAGADRRTLTVAASWQSGHSASGYFSNGELEVLTGANAGLRREIKTHVSASGAASLVLQVPLPFLCAAGDSVRLTAGCDRRLATCKGKFNNIVHFRGEPHIPGNDVLVKRGRQEL